MDSNRSNVVGSRASTWCTRASHVNANTRQDKTVQQLTLTAKEKRTAGSSMALLLLVNECGVSLNNGYVQPMSLKRSSMSFSIPVVRLSSECFLQSISFKLTKKSWDTTLPALAATVSRWRRRRQFGYQDCCHRATSCQHRRGRGFCQRQTQEFRHRGPRRQRGRA
jgi:hypothetical protein